MSTDNRVLAARKNSGTLTGVQRIMHKPAVAHVVRAAKRFGERLGNQFGAAVTYFSVLAIIPTLMFAFAALGFTLEVVKPEWMELVRSNIQQAAPGQDQLVTLLDSYLSNWEAVGIVGILTALYTAQGWMGNLKDAIRTMIRDDMGEKPQENFVLRTLSNIFLLIGLLLGIGVAAVMLVVGTTLSSRITEWLSLPGWATPVLAIVPPLLGIGVAWLVYQWFFATISKEKVPPHTRMLAALMAAVCTGVLVSLSGLLIKAFSASPTAALFGPVIAIMVSLNLFARLLLFVAAWIGTTDERPIFHKGRIESPAALEADGRAETVGAVVVSAGMIALTLLGINRWEQRKERAGGS